MNVQLDDILKSQKTMLDIAVASNQMAKDQISKLSEENAKLKKEIEELKSKQK